MPQPTKKQTTKRLGCGFVLSTGATLTGLFLLNILFVKVFFSPQAAGIHQQLFHIFQFIIPLAMLAIEFWFYDLLVNRSRIPRDKSKPD